ncbi:PucR family transcriptional regulator [Streptomyces sp. HC44]|uniref:PucR family transcriptional regulator n=1 Tax=Streptomyces scabichelini TaxID=2711217 RepID=A0A6G4VGC9_9ACTN|nr:PucR family transcriptional regulator [Streptomyces scabichelini]NGO13146.1 PucR family transcriptional regulator [Streptomyces scabichelini]
MTMTAPQTGVASLVAALGAELLRPLHLPADADPSIGDPVIWDAESEPPPGSHSILLMVGGRSSVAAARGALHEAARLGYAAAVVKAYGEDPDRWRRCAAEAGIPVLLAPDDTPWRHLDSLISAIVASEAGRTNVPDLSRVAIGDLFSLANAVAAMVGSAITIEDVDRRLLAYSNIEGQPIDSCRRRTILGRQVPDDPLYSDEYRVLAHRDGPAGFPAYPERGGDFARLAVSVRAGSRVLGSIWAIDSGGIDAVVAGQTLSSVTGIVAMHLLHGGTTTDLKRVRRSEWLTGLLSSRAPDRDTPSEFPLSPKKPAVLLGFRMNARPGEVVDSARVMDLVAVFCESHHKKAACTAFDDTVLALLPAALLPRDQLVFLARQIIDSARSSLGVKLIAAVGDAVTSVQEVTAGRSETERGLRALLHRPERGPVLDIAASREVLALEELAESAWASRTRPLPVLTRILEYDRVHGTEYLATLRVHLDSGGDALVAAQRLTVHVNTFRYRLRRLSELFDLDLSEPEFRLAVWLQMRILAPFR